MRLRNPGTIDAAINAVEDLRRYLSNARSGNSLGPADPFLSWCEDYARPQLENWFAPTEGLFDDLDASYNLINNAPKSKRGASTQCSAERASPGIGGWRKYSTSWASRKNLRCGPAVP